MLNIPESGFNRSVEHNNFNMNLFCDWIEVNLLFIESEISQSDIVDILVENHLVDDNKKDDLDDQDMAYQIISDVWTTLENRLSSVKSILGISITAQRVSRTGTWKDHPVYAFCLLMSCRSYLYPSWVNENLTNDWMKKNIPKNIPTYGTIFESIAHESVSKMLQGWEVKQVGWSADNAVPLKGYIDELIKLLDEVEGSEKDLLVTSKVKEMGLDLLAYYTFNDSRASKPIFMFQCASGKDWNTKLQTPDIFKWGKVISFSCKPLKGFVMPYSFNDAQDFRRKTIEVDGLVIDRYRLINPQGKVATSTRKLSNFFSSSLDTRVKKWIEPQLNAIIGDLKN